MDNNTILTQIKNNNSIAFKQLFDSYYNSLCFYLLNYTNDKDSSEELAQIVFVKFWDKRHNIDIHTSIRPYLYKMAYNEFLTQLRKKNKEASLIEELKYKALETYETISDEDLEIKAKKLVNSISQLPSRCQEILKYKMEGLKYREIAETLGISIKTVESQIRTAFIKIREDFEEDLVLFFCL